MNKIKVGHQGLKGAFSYICAKEIFPENEIVSFQTFEEVANAVEEEKIDYGVSPFKNSYAGDVIEVQKILEEKKDKLKIVDKKTIPIVHNLCGLQGAKIEDITQIFSHWQALKQCQKILQKIAPKAILVEKENTAISAEYVKKQQNKNFACICSKLASKENTLQVFAENIQDDSNNRTTFVIVAKK